MDDLVASSRGSLQMDRDAARPGGRRVSEHHRVTRRRLVLVAAVLAVLSGCSSAGARPVAPPVAAAPAPTVEGFTSRVPADGRTTGAVPTGLYTRDCIIDVQHAASLGGPWSAREAITSLSCQPLCPTNPAPVIAPDGEVTLYYRAYDPSHIVKGSDEYLYKASAARWQGPYHPDGTTPVLAVPAEDATVWEGAGEFYVLYNNKFNNPALVGGYASSVDGASFTAQPPLYGLTLRYDDGRTSTVARRERPSLLRTGPRSWVLFTAVQPSSTSDHTMIVATSVSAP